MGRRDYEFNVYCDLVKYYGTDPHEHVPHQAYAFQIRDRAFQDCKTLESIELPEGCVCIGESAFENCVNLLEITLPLSLSSIHERAFANCRNLKVLKFPRGIYNGQFSPYYDRLSICGSAFDNCTSLADGNGFVVIDNMAQNHLLPGTDITVTDGIQYFSRGLFLGRKDIRRVYLPDSLLEISSTAFRDCKNLESINIPRTVRSIHQDAFLGCDNLYSADSDFLILDGWLCGYRGKSSQVKIPEGVAAIADSVFKKRGEIRSVIFPESVRHIGLGCFDGCTGLEEIDLPPSLEILKWGTFRDCTALRSVRLPDGLKKIEDNVFAKCSALCDISLPEGLTDIGRHAFGDCVNLPPLAMPESLVNIHRDALAGTPVPIREDGLIIAAGKVSGYQGPGGEVFIPEGITEICSYAFGHTAITGIRFPKSLRQIGERAFDSCEKLTTVVFQEGLEAIGRSAFCDCAIQEICFPESLRTIENNAFRANNIHEVILPNELQILGNNAFENCPVRSIAIHKNLFRDYGTRPGEHSRWVDHDVDNNPFPYKDGTLISIQLICPDTEISRENLAQWAKLLHLENPIIQIWSRSWDDDMPHLKADDYMPEDINYYGPYLESAPPKDLPEWVSDWSDHLVVILHRQEIENMIQADDISVAGYLKQIGPEILRELIALAEQTAAQKVLPLLHNLLNQYDHS